MAELLQKLPLYLGGHLTLSLAALAVGLLVSLPLGIAASRRPRLAEGLLGAAGIIQTVPSLALLALMVPLLGGMIGFWPALLALVLYSILPILANTVVGIRGVDPALIEAARGLGMSPRQMLCRVELPLAAPVILGGVRTATVLVVGMVTLVTTVGGASLGNYIFSGLESFNDLWTSRGLRLRRVVGLVLDQLVHLLELAAQRRSRWLAWAGAGGLLLAVAASLYYPVIRDSGLASRAGADGRRRRSAETSSGARAVRRMGHAPGGSAAETARLPGRAHGAVAECFGGGTAGERAAGDPGQSPAEARGGGAGRGWRDSDRADPGHAGPDGAAAPGPGRLQALVPGADAVQHPAHPGQHGRGHSRRGTGLDRGRARPGDEQAPDAVAASSCRWPLR